MEITEIKLRRIMDDGQLRGIFSVTFNNQFVVHDIKLIETEEGDFVSMPSRRMKNGKYQDIAHPINKDYRNFLEEEIKKYYYSLVKSD